MLSTLKNLVLPLLKYCICYNQLFCTFLIGFLTVHKGQVTFNAEGNNNRKSRFYSRKPHVPGGNSGITIGRGYDMGQKSIKEVITDLLQAGVSKLFASMLAKGAGLQGQSATDFLEVSLKID